MYWRSWLKVFEWKCFKNTFHVRLFHVCNATAAWIVCGSSYQHHLSSIFEAFCQIVLSLATCNQQLHWMMVMRWKTNENWNRWTWKIAWGLNSRIPVFYCFLWTPSPLISFNTELKNCVMLAYSLAQPKLNQKKCFEIASNTNSHWKPFFRTWIFFL